MKEYNINSLLSNNQIINIKNDDGDIVKVIKFRKLSATRTFEIADKYNELIAQNTDDLQGAKDIGKSKKLFSNLIDLCFDIIRPLTFMDRLKYRFSKNYISKKWLMDNFDIDGLNDFMAKILEPISGGTEKKT